ncbi:hypothetical protein KR222_010119 [Zaprionus bogoriensis]|nr:hypothetical protein KR222_010119 [Zaprionus bogoriensis]
MILASIFVCFCLASAFHYFRTRRQRRLVANLKGPFAWPLLGAMHKIVLLTQKNFFQHSASYLRKYGALSRCWIFHRLFIPVADLEFASQLLLCPKSQATGHELMQCWLGGNVLTCQPQHWQQRHQLLASFFKLDNMLQLKQLLRQQAEQLQAELKQQAEGRKVCDAWQLVSAHLLDTMLLIGCGVHASQEYKQAFAELTELYRQRFLSIKSANRFTFWLGSPLMRLRQQKLIKRLNHANKLLLAERRQRQQNATNDQLKSEGIQIEHHEDRPKLLHASLIDVLLASDSLTDEEVCAELNNCNYLGYLLCSTTLCFAMVLIARHPSVQQRCLDELQAAGSEQEWKLDALPYLEAVLQETLRLQPPQLIVGRQLSQDFDYSKWHMQVDFHCDCILISLAHSLVGAGTLPAGAEIYINLYELQRSEQHYGPRAGHFEPERFLVEAPNLLSFGLGPRSCPARQFSLLLLKSLLATLLRHYELLPYGDAVRPNLRLAPSSCNGFQLALRQRV